MWVGRNGDVTAEASHLPLLCESTAAPSEPPKLLLACASPMPSSEFDPSSSSRCPAWGHGTTVTDPARFPGQVDKIRGEGGGWWGALERAPCPSPAPAQPLPAEDVPAEGDNAPGFGRPQFQGNNWYLGNAKVTSWDGMVTREGVLGAWGGCLLLQQSELFPGQPPTSR